MLAAVKICKTTLGAIFKVSGSKKGKEPRSLNHCLEAENSSNNHIWLIWIKTKLFQGIGIWGLCNKEADIILNSITKYQHPKYRTSTKTQTL